VVHHHLNLLTCSRPHIPSGIYDRNRCCFKSCFVSNANGIATIKAFVVIVAIASLQHALGG
jgi:hypothetical protein